MVRSLFAVVPIGLFALSSCLNKSIINESFELNTGQHIFPKNECYYPIAHAKDCHLFKDSILVVLNYNKIGCSVLTVHHKYSGKNEYLYTYGSGPQDFLGALLSRSSRFLVLHDFVKERFAVLDPITDEPSVPVYHKTNIHSQFIGLAHNGRLLFINPYSVPGKPPRFLFSDRDYNYLVKKKHQVDRYNVTDGFVLENEKEQLYYLIDKHEGIIELWYKNTSLIKTLIGIDTPYASYDIISSGKHKMCVFKGAIPISFSCACNNQSYIAIIVDPSYLNIDGQLYYLSPSASILLLNWKGEILQSYSLPEGIHPNSISFLEDGSVAVHDIDEEFIYEGVFSLSS